MQVQLRAIRMSTIWKSSLRPITVAAILLILLAVDALAASSNSSHPNRFTIAPAQNASSGSISTVGLLDCLNVAATGKPSMDQKAVLFFSNDRINNLRLAGVITDKQYQAAQKVYDSMNQEFGKASAECPSDEARGC